MEKRCLPLLLPSTACTNSSLCNAVLSTEKRQCIALKKDGGGENSYVKPLVRPRNVTSQPWEKGQKDARKHTVHVQFYTSKVAYFLSISD